MKDYFKFFVDDKKIFANNIKENKFKKILFIMYDFAYNFSNGELDKIFIEDLYYNGFYFRGAIFKYIENSDFFEKLKNNYKKIKI